MARFKVIGSFTATDLYEVEVEIEADSEEQAEQIAKARNEAGKLDWQHIRETECTGHIFQAEAIGT